MSEDDIFFIDMNIYYFSAHVNDIYSLIQAFTYGQFSLLKDWHFSLSIIWLFDASLTETLTLLYSWKSRSNWITLEPYRIKESYKILVNHWLW